MNKKKNIWTYFIKMFLVFMVIFFASQLGQVILLNSFTYLKYGPEIISQSIWAVLIVIVVFSFKNSYIFKEERENITSGLKLGWPILVLSAIFLILNIILGILEGSKFSIPVILNLGVYCLLIGLVEELMCRGWLLNEFLERFSNTKKNTIISIVLSSVVFGFIHIFNIISGQSLSDTLVQVLNATIFGIALGLIYYKTKNIWSVILIHAIWDFCLMLGESTNIVDCVPGTITNSIVIYNIIIAIVIAISDGIICYWLYKQTNLVDETKKLTKTIYYILPIVSIVLYTGMNFIEPKDYDDYYICPKYETKNFSTEFEVEYYSHLKYDLEISKHISLPEKEDGAYISHIEQKYSFSLLLNEETNKIELQNNSTKEKVVLTENMTYDYLLIENKDSYVILIQNDYNKVLYGLYQKDDVSNDKKYLEDVKEQLKEYIVPEINLIGSVKIGSSEYKYAQIQTRTYDRLYFDETGTLYIVTTE